MNLFSRLYDKVLIWAKHRYAPWYLVALSFAEASFFPIPPDVMLAPMSLAQPNRVWYFATLATIASAAGGERMESYLRTYIDKLGWLLAFVVLVAFVVIQL